MTEDAATSRDESLGRSLTEAAVREIVRRILTVLRPFRVILFGSAATGTMTRDSDIDVLVVAETVSDARADALRV